MGSLALLRRVNRTLGWVAPGLVASKMHSAFALPRKLAPKAWELPVLAAAERITLPGQLSALRWGKGPAVWLMHGWEGRPTQFAALIPSLVAAGYQVVGIEGPAHGDSPGERASVVSFAAALLQAAHGQPALRAIIGHSMGGASAMLAIKQGLRTQALVTISTPSHLGGVLGRYVSAVGLPPPARTAFMRAVERESGVPVADVDVRRIRLDLPGLVIHAEDDLNVPVDDARIIHEAWFDSRLLRLDTGGHQRVLADPRTIEAVMALLGPAAEKVA